MKGFADAWPAAEHMCGALDGIPKSCGNRFVRGIGQSDTSYFTHQCSKPEDTVIARGHYVCMLVLCMSVPGMCVASVVGFTGRASGPCGPCIELIEPCGGRTRRCVKSVPVTGDRFLDKQLCAAHSCLMSLGSA